MAAQENAKARQTRKKDAHGFDWRVAEPLELLAASRTALERYASETGARLVEPSVRNEHAAE
jgi:hypothetical protein